MNLSFVADYYFPVQIWTIESKQTRKEGFESVIQRNWDLSTNSDFLIPVSLQPNVVDLRCRSMDSMDKTIPVWNIKGLRHQVAKINGFATLSLWQRFEFPLFSVYVKEQAR